MTDNDLFALLISTVEAGLVAWPLPGFTVEQKQQPTQQGIPVDKTVYIEKLFDRAYGHAAVSYTTNIDPDKLNENEKQLYQSTFQFTAQVRQRPEDITIPTASDVVSAVRAIVQRRSTLRLLAAENVSVLRVSEIHNPYITGDQDRQEAMPTFDLVVNYVRDIPPVVVDKLVRVDTSIHQV